MALRPHLPALAVLTGLAGCVLPSSGPTSPATPTFRLFEGILEFDSVERGSVTRFACTVGLERMLCTTSSGQSAVVHGPSGLLCSPARGRANAVVPMPLLVAMMRSLMPHFGAPSTPTGRTFTIEGRPCVEEESRTVDGAARACRATTIHLAIGPAICNAVGPARCGPNNDAPVLAYDEFDATGTVKSSLFVRRIEERPIDPSFFIGSSC